MGFAIAEQGCLYIRTRWQAVWKAVITAGNTLGGPDFRPVAFVDDKKVMQGSSIHGIRVHDTGLLPDLVRHRRIERILLAMPTASRRRRREVLTHLEPLGIHVQSMPNLSDLISG